MSPNKQTRCKSIENWIAWLGLHIAHIDKHIYTSTQHSRMHEFLWHLTLFSTARNMGNHIAYSYKLIHKSHFC